MENRFAAARRRYLRTHMDGIYTGMLLTGTLEPHLKEIGESAQAMFDRIVEQMKKAEGVTEQLKAADQMDDALLSALAESFCALDVQRIVELLSSCSWMKDRQSRKLQKLAQ